MTTGKGLETRPEGMALAGPNLIDPTQLGIIQANIELLETKVKAMLRPGEDYGRLPGMQKPTLFDSGAGTIRAVYNIYPDQEILLHEENSEGIRYVIKVKGIHRDTGRIVASGVGSASSGEIKYAYRWVNAKDLGNQPKEGLKTKLGFGGATLYRIDNPDIPDLDNTLLKMAAKRAEVDMTLQLPGVSRVFTQDIGDLKRPSRTSPPLQSSKVVDAEPGTVEELFEEASEAQAKGPQEGQQAASGPQRDVQAHLEAQRPALEKAEGSPSNPPAQGSGGPKPQAGPHDWTAFWTALSKLPQKFAPAQVLEILGVPSLHAWVKQGRTLEDALEVLRQHKEKEA